MHTVNLCRSRLIAAGALAVAVGGCGPSYYDLRKDGQESIIRGEYSAAAILFNQADAKSPRHVANLHDLGICHTMVARHKFEQRNAPAAFRELDKAIAYYQRALDVRPGNLPCTEGLNTALELKGQFEEALKKAEWAVKFVGPKAKQQLYLARELEERGDSDAALLRFRQAVAMEPANAEAHKAIAEFLLRHHQEVPAMHHLRAAYQLDPDNAWVRQQLASRGGLPQSRPALDGPF
jgi:tetratricopeptide (TPR) repeat protein